jgi:hypothetical protein
VKVGATTTWLTRDHSQSIRLSTDASGALIDFARYAPYGAQAPSLPIAKGFIGERHDAETTNPSALKGKRARSVSRL